MRSRFYIILIIFIAAVSLAAELQPLLNSIRIQGNERFSQREIISWTELEIGAPLNENALKQAMDNILSHLEFEGHYFASIDSMGEEYSDDSSRIDLTIYITENPRIQLKTVIVSDSSQDNLPLLESYFKQNVKFTLFRLEEGIEDVLNAMDESGHPFAQLRLNELQLIRLPDAAEINASFFIEPGPEVILSGVEISGNKNTRNSFIIRETRIKPNSLFSAQAFERAQRYLERTMLFETVEPLQIIRRQDDYYALVKVKEGKHNSIDGALGYMPRTETQDGYWTGLLDFAFNNLFGTARKFHIHWEQPDRYSQDIALYYREPWIGGIPLDVSVSLDQSVRATSGFLSLGGEDKFLNRNMELTGYYLLNENIEIEGGITNNEVIPDSAARYILGMPHSLAWGLKAGFTIDNRDNHLNPRKGIRYRNLVTAVDKKNYVAANYSIPPNVKEKRIELDFEAVFQLSQWSVFDLRMSARHLESPQQDIPISEMYFLGGSRSLRGYREEQFAGTSIAWANIEYRWLLSKYSRIFVFNDWGYYYRTAQSIPVNEAWHYGYGCGIRLETALGIIGIDYGLGESDAILNGKLHFRLRNDF